MKNAFLLVCFAIGFIIGWITNRVALNLAFALKDIIVLLVLVLIGWAVLHFKKKT